ncbi:MAG: MgtC/SapB family protein [Nanoarchaeota archaeon]
MDLLTPIEMSFLVKITISLIISFILGWEREGRGKDAGTSTHFFVIAGAMLFTLLSVYMDPNEPARIAANVVVGVGFLGAGIILHKKAGHITNLTTAASMWFSAALGMAIGFGWYIPALMGTVFSLLVTLVPRFPAFKQ